MSGIYDVTLAAGATANVGVLGNYFKVRSAPYGLVAIKLDGGESFAMDEGLGVRLPDGKYFRDVSITNKSASAQTILVFIGDSRFEDTRITGTVRVIDQSADKTNIGKQFFGTAGTGASAGNVSFISVAANGGNVAIRSILVQSGSAGLITIGTANGAGTTNPIGAVFANKVINGGSAGLARKSGGLATSATPTGAEVPGYTLVAQVYVPANTPVAIPIGTPWVLTGANQIVMHGSVVNRDVSATFELEEL